MAPYPFSYTAIYISLLPYSMLFTVRKLACILYSFFIYKYAISMTFSILIFPIIVRPICPAISTTTTYFALRERTNIFFTICPNIFTLSVKKSILNFTFISCSIYPSKFSFTVLVPIVETSYVYHPFVCLFTKSMTLIIFPLPIIY